MGFKLALRDLESLSSDSLEWTLRAMKMGGVGRSGAEGRGMTDPRIRRLQCGSTFQCFRENFFQFEYFKIEYLKQILLEASIMKQYMAGKS